MNQKKLSDLTNQELLEEAKKNKSSNVLNAFLIGIMFGVIIFSVVKNTLGFFTLIPLFFASKLSKKSQYNKEELDKILTDRNLN